MLLSLTPAAPPFSAMNSTQCSLQKSFFLKPGHNRALSNPSGGTLLSFASFNKRRASYRSQPDAK
jgi:hypothetical protein